MSTSLTPRLEHRAWSIALWSAQTALLIVYLMAGGMKLTQPMEALAASGMGFVLALPTPFVRFVGLMEVLGAIGVVAPAATRILPFLTPWAAAGLSLVQVSAMVLHVSRGELTMLPVNLALLALSLFVLWGRTRLVPVAHR